MVLLHLILFFALIEIALFGFLLVAARVLQRTSGD